MDVVLEAVTNDKYIAFVFQDDDLIKSFYSEKSPLLRIYGAMGYEAIREIVTLYGFDFQSIDLENSMVLLYISEKNLKCHGIHIRIQIFYYDKYVIIMDMINECCRA